MVMSLFYAGCAVQAHNPLLELKCTWHRGKSRESLNRDRFLVGNIHVHIYITSNINETSCKILPCQVRLSQRWMYLLFLLLQQKKCLYNILVTLFTLTDVRFLKVTIQIQYSVCAKERSCDSNFFWCVILR